MPENWPDTLPQDWLMDGNQETRPAVALRTQMQAGPAKTRREFTAQVTPLKRRMVMTAAQKDIFDDFFDTTIAGGALSFTFPHDGTDVLRSVKEPTLSQNGPNWFMDWELEKLP